MESVVVAYSGGVDSAFLLKVAHDCLGDKAIAVTAISESLPYYERDEAIRIATWIGVRQVQINSKETDNPQYLSNTPDRCYFCKNEVYGELIEYAHQNGFKYVVDGTNADDIGDHRPGRKAAREYGIVSPLLDEGFTKSDIRDYARTLQLPNWDKPSAACLSSRIPYGTTITKEMLTTVALAELSLKKLGTNQLRVRHHEKLARIEVNTEDFQIVIDNRDEIISAFRALGYTFITLDIAGFRSGSMNEALTPHGYKQTT
jgi:uncharacterized protein